MDSQSAALLRRLNPFCAQALEAAASLCQTRAHAEIQPEHWLLKLLEQGEGDITVIARRYEWDMDGIWQDLLAFLDRQPRTVRGRPQLSSSLETLLKQAWLMASASDNNPQIRSIHLLMALSGQPSLVRCEGLWPLLARFQTVIYRPLARDAMRNIVEMKLSQVSQRLQRHYGIRTTLGEGLYDMLTDACLLPDTGARNVDSLLNQQILPVLSQQILSHRVVGHCPQHLTMDCTEKEGIVLAFDEVNHE